MSPRATFDAEGLAAYVWMRRAEANSLQISAEETTPSRLRLPLVSRTPGSGSTLGS